MRHAHKIPRIVMKNFTLIFRNWPSFALLIFGPLCLLLIIGIVFSSQSISGITIGIVQESEGVRDFFEEEFGQAFNVHTFENETPCVEELVREQSSICVVLSEEFSMLTTQNFSADQLPAGGVKLIYDNSKALVSKTLVNYLQERFGITGSEIALEAVSEVVADIKNIRRFLEKSTKDISTYLSELEQTQSAMESYKGEISDAVSALDETIVELEKLQSDANNASSYLNIRQLRETLKSSDSELADIESEVHKYQSEFDDSKGTLQTGLFALQVFESQYKNTLSPEAQLALEVADIDNLLETVAQTDLEQLEDDMDEVSDSIAILRTDIQTFDKVGDNFTKELPNQLEQLDSMVNKTKQMREVLATSLTFTTSITDFMSQSKQSLESLSAGLKKNAVALEPFDSTDTESLVSPITLESDPLLGTTSKIILLFPIFIPLIIIFISTLFSNSILLDEIYSTAQLRNFILPLQDIYVVLGFFFTNLLLVLFQVGIFYTIAIFTLEVPLLAAPLDLFILTVLLSSVFILLGMVIAYITNSKENSVLLCTFIAVGILFASDVFIPLEFMKSAVSSIIGLSPFVLAESVIRTSMFYQVGIFANWWKFLLLIVYISGLFSLLMYIVHRHRHSYHARE